MALTPRLDFRQTQAPVMTPQLQQAIKLLQLSNLELAAFVESELEENPLLEREESIADAGPPESEAQPTSDDGDAASLGDKEELSSTEAPLDSDYTNVYPDDPFRPAGGSAPAARGDSDSLPGIDQTAASEVTLREHMIEQLDLSIGDPTQRLIGRALIDSLDDRGYLTTSMDELGEQLGCDCLLYTSPSPRDRG